MIVRPRRSTLVLFGVMAVYIVIQFLWWGVLLLRKDAETHRLATEVMALGGDPGLALDPARGLRMVLGEGIVFLLLLVLVLFLTFRSIRRDLAFARTQRNFLLAVSHELRTPIAAIKLQLQTLGRAGLEEAHAVGLKEQALAEVDRLALLTDKVLLATRAEEGVVDIRTSEVDVMGALRDLLARARSQYASGHQLEILGPDQVVVRTDPEALRSIVDNLVENAAKYAPPGTVIRLEVIHGRDGWRLLISDEGPGIPPAERTRVFDKFYRVGNEETRRTQGTGLGLYIVQRLAQRLGGAVTIQDRPGGGSIFAASFPNR